MVTENDPGKNNFAVGEIVIKDTFSKALRGRVRSVKSKIEGSNEKTAE